MSTGNVVLYGETGHFPLVLDRYIRIIQYWLKIANSDYNNCIVKAVNFSLLEVIDKSENTVNWASKVQNLLQRTGLYDVWLFPDSVIHSKFIPIFKLRVRDQHIADWNQNLSASSLLQLHKVIKPTISIATYLEKVLNIKYTKAISKIRDVVA